MTVRFKSVLAFDYKYEHGGCVEQLQGWTHRTEVDGRKLVRRDMANAGSEPTNPVSSGQGAAAVTIFTHRRVRVQRLTPPSYVGSGKIWL